MWIVERPDGSHQYFSAQPDPVRDAPIARQAETDSLPAADGTEDWDFDTQSFVVNVARAEAWIDRQYTLTHGQSAISVAHAIKVLEARLHQHGIEVDGMLAAEATATEQDLATLADTVLTQAWGEMTAEVQRIVLKREARAV